MGKSGVKRNKRSPLCGGAGLVQGGGRVGSRTPVLEEGLPTQESGMTRVPAGLGHVPFLSNTHCPIENGCLVINKR